MAAWQGRAADGNKAANATANHSAPFPVSPGCTEVGRAIKGIGYNEIRY
jgi:hypothetical protein